MPITGRSASVKVSGALEFGRRQSLVGGLNPSEKYARQIGNLPQIGVFFFFNETTSIHQLEVISGAGSRIMVFLGGLNDHPQKLKRDEHTIEHTSPNIEVLWLVVSTHLKILVKMGIFPK